MMLVIIEDPDHARVVLLGQQKKLLEFHGRLLIRLLWDVHKEVVLVLGIIFMHTVRKVLAGAQYFKFIVIVQYTQPVITKMQRVAGFSEMILDTIPLCLVRISQCGWVMKKITYLMEDIVFQKELDLTKINTDQEVLQQVGNANIARKIEDMEMGMYIPFAAQDAVHLMLNACIDYVQEVSGTLVGIKPTGVAVTKTEYVAQKCLLL